MKDIFILITPLLIITILLVGTLLIVKRFSLNGKLKRKNLLDFQLVASFSLMPKKYLAVVKVQNEYLLLGISDNSISLIKELKIEQELIENDYPENQSQGFSEIFKKMLKGQ